MALYKRTPGGPWWVRFTVRGRAVRKSAKTDVREDAEEFETALRARYWRQAQLGEQVHTWRDAVTRYKKEANWRPSTRATNEFSLQFFSRIDSVAVAAITADVVRAARECVERTQRVSSANRIMSVFRGVLRACVRWGWLTHAPPVPMGHAQQRPATYLSVEDCKRLVAELPGHLKGPVEFSLLTGLRMSNVRDLTWARVDLLERHATVPSSEYKTNRDHGIALSDAAVDLLSKLPRESPYVFTYKGKKIASRFNNHAFRKARIRAGLPHLRWHDLRHTFASWLAQKGASDRVLQQMGGWASPKMVARYAHLRAEDTRQWANAVGTNLVSSTETDSKNAPNPLKLVPSI